MADVALIVNGKRYSGWKSIRITRGIEAVAGAFELTVSDRWDLRGQSWPIVEEDECQVTFDGVPMITGYVDGRDISYSASDHSFTVSGRDKAGAMVDCSAVLDRWNFKSVPLLDLITKIAAPFDVLVWLDASVREGLPLPKPPAKFTVDPGEKAFEVIDRACRLAGVLPVSDGVGGLRLTRAGSARCTTALVEGENILSAAGSYKATERYRRYIVRGQHQATDDWSGASVAAVKGEATDPTVRRSERVLLIRPERGVTQESAKSRAAYEAKVRAARGDAVTVTVQGWSQGSGELWPVNAIVQLRSPALGMQADLLITQAVFILDASGQTTQLSLKRPDAFIPETVIKKPGGNGYWKEIRRGSLT